MKSDSPLIIIMTGGIEVKTDKFNIKNNIIKSDSILYFFGLKVKVPDEQHGAFGDIYILKSFLPPII